jgi:hypothetical protein
MLKRVYSLLIALLPFYYLEKQGLAVSTNRFTFTLNFLSLSVGFEGFEPYLV